MYANDLVVISLVASAICLVSFIYLLGKTLWEERKAATFINGIRLARRHLGYFRVVSKNRIFLMLAMLYLALVFGFFAWLFSISDSVSGVHGYL